jgi:hypothetical protein
MMNCLVTTSKFASIEQARAYIQSCTADMKAFCSSSLQNNQEFLQKYSELTPMIYGVFSGILIAQGIHTLAEKGLKSKLGWAQVVAGIGGAFYTVAHTSTTINAALSSEPTKHPLCDSSPRMDAPGIIENLLMKEGSLQGNRLYIHCEQGVWDRQALVYNQICKVNSVREKVDDLWSAQCNYDTISFPGTVQVIAYAAG